MSKITVKMAFFVPYKNTLIFLEGWQPLLLSSVWYNLPLIGDSERYNLVKHLEKVREAYGRLYHDVYFDPDKMDAATIWKHLLQFYKRVAKALDKAPHADWITDFLLVRGYSIGRMVLDMLHWHGEKFEIILYDASKKEQLIRKFDSPHIVTINVEVKHSE